MQEYTFILFTMTHQANHQHLCQACRPAYASWGLLEGNLLDCKKKKLYL